MKTMATVYTDLLSLSLLLEPSAYPKPGNVHRTRDLPGLKYEDFLVTGIIAYKWLYRGVRRGLRGFGKIVFGDLIYYTLKEVLIITRRSNTCLGSMLLLAPLGIAVGKLLKNGGEVTAGNIVEEVCRILPETTVYDSIYFYRAVRLAAPRYVKPRDQIDGYVNVWDPAYRKKLVEKNQILYEILEYSAKRDIVAHELIYGYPRSLEAKIFLEKRLNKHCDWNRAVVETYLKLLSQNQDTVIKRLYGEQVAKHVSWKAKETLKEIQDKENWVGPVEELDRELRRQAINPASIADLVVSTIALYLIDNKHVP